jgi:hypothetical protein
MTTPQKEALAIRVEHDLGYRKPNDEQIGRIERLRELFTDASKEVIDLCPEGRELSQALSHLDEGMGRAIAAIVREGRS